MAIIMMIVLVIVIVIINLTMISVDVVVVVVIRTNSGSKQYWQFQGDRASFLSSFMIRDLNTRFYCYNDISEYF